MLRNIRCAAFEKSIQIYCTLTILICKKKIYINIASINITLTEINKEAHYVGKNIKKHPKKQAKNKPPPLKNKSSQNCSDKIRTVSVILLGLRSSDYTITAMVQ